ncbi:MAG: hypothetical protein ACTHK1_00170 [Actinomycetales bacterium]
MAIAAFVVVEGGVWLLRDSWWERGLALVVGLLVLPVAVALSSR